MDSTSLRRQTGAGCRYRRVTARFSRRAIAIDGNRRAAVSKNTWADATQSAYPDWLRVDFSGSKKIGEIHVFTGQASDTVEPTTTMTSSYTIADFQVQYWTGAQWVAVPGGTVTGNRNIWRKFVFAPLTTTAIRVVVTRSQVMFSRIAEVEAYDTSAAPPPQPPPPQAAIFEVGPSKAYLTPADVPWETLSAGDTVLIHWRSTPYKNKWVISAQGTATAPIIVRGVPGPQGQLPVIDGNGATTRLALDYWNEIAGGHQDRRLERPGRHDAAPHHHRESGRARRAPAKQVHR